jgi:hypothetical protein
MVGKFDRQILGVLDAMHATAHADGQERTWRANGWARSTAARWHRNHRLTYFPNIAFESLGLVHEHLILERLPPAIPFLVEAAWLRAPDGRRVLYAHCLRPAESRTFERFVRSTSCTRITTRDPWQQNSGLVRTITAKGQLAVVPQHDALVVPRAVAAADLIRSYPLIIPVSLETVGQRRTTQDVWAAVLQKLGSDVWSYLPRGYRRWRHNGKRYVREALALLSRHGLVRQHIVRYDALHAHLAELLLITRDPGVGRRAPLLETYPGDGLYVLRALGDVHLLKEACRSTEASWWLIEEHHPASVDYTSFDPHTGTWRTA